VERELVRLRAPGAMRCERRGRARQESGGGGVYACRERSGAARTGSASTRYSSSPSIEPCMYWSISTPAGSRRSGTKTRADHPRGGAVARRARAEATYHSLRSSQWQARGCARCAGERRASPWWRYLQHGRRIGTWWWRWRWRQRSMWLVSAAQQPNLPQGAREEGKRARQLLLYTPSTLTTTTLSMAATNNHYYDSDTSAHSKAGAKEREEEDGR